MTRMLTKRKADIRSKIVEVLLLGSLAITLLMLLVLIVDLIQRSWTVWTDRPTAALVSHRNVTFVAEGWHTVHVTVDGTSLTDAVGPFLIDSTAPWLDITSPPRGTVT